MLPVRLATPLHPQSTLYRLEKRCFEEMLWSILASILLSALGVLPWANQLFAWVNALPAEVGAGKYLSKACAIGFCRAGTMMLPGIGLRSVLPLESTNVL